MNHFVNENSIVREIWGKSDTILFIFAGASAEFALNKAVDWLYFTGKLPKDPLARLFSTVTYARKIVFSDKDAAFKAIDAINSIHGSVEKKRGKNIPDWAYKDVLFLLIDYSISAYELLERELEQHEKQEVLNVFNEVGTRMNIKDLPKTYEAFQKFRQEHLHKNLYKGAFTKDLYKQYYKHLGVVRYWFLIETQILLLPRSVANLFHLRNFTILSLMLPLYKVSRKFHLDSLIKTLLLPKEYKEEIKNLNYL